MRNITTTNQDQQRIETYENYVWEIIINKFYEQKYEIYGGMFVLVI